ncbi:MAG: T9SS type A sorting domain-containing protein [Phycisphaerae bacterium]|nr:T9SS type A sorting domain-containing protein [Saprospiraceae bacterium]
MKKYLYALFILFTGSVFSQSAALTPVSDIGVHSVSVIVPSKYISAFPAGRILNIPTNYTVSVYHAGGLNKPRFMAFSPSGILHVSDMNAGKVFALPDANMDGVADTIREAATGFSNNHDVKFFKGAMYVTETTRIWKCTDLNADGFYETKTIFINNIGNNQTGGHVTRTLVFDSINQKVYVSVGSSCNVCRETARAIIEEYNEDGSNRSVFATGVRNAVGMAMHPVTNRLWANNNGSDLQGNEIPPEWIDIVRENGFYGHPFVYGGGVWFNFASAGYQALLPITAVDSAKVETLVHPAALIRAHSAPMALAFLNEHFGTTLQHGFLSALRGSWNTTDPNDFRGYKVIYGHLSSGQDTTVDYVADFCSGFITDTINRIFWGRPVGIAIDNNGKVYISSDEGNKFILVLTPDEASDVAENNLILTAVNLFPNPVKNQFTLSLTLTQSVRVRAVFSDIFGREVLHLMDQNLSVGNHKQQMDVNGLPSGNYFITITAGQNSVVKKLIVIN